MTTRSGAAVVLLSFAGLGWLNAGAQQLEPVALSTRAAFSDDGAWCWFQNPRAVYVEGRHRRTYAQWMTRDGTLEIGSYDHDTGEIQTHTLKEEWGADDHNVGSFLVLPDHRLMVFYATHGDRGLYCRVSRDPEAISDWEDEVTVVGGIGVTYSHPVYLSEEKRFYVFWRGTGWKPTYSTSPDGKIWSDPQVLIRQEGREGQGVRPYICIVSDGKSSIHFAFTDGHPRDEPLNSLYYLRYEDGAFYKADGTKVGGMESLPIQHSGSDRVYDAAKAGARAWVWDIALDEDGSPVIAYTRLPAETDHRYAYARWTGTEWLDVEITPGGGWFPQTPEGNREPEPHYSGGIAIDHDNPSVVYLSRPVEGRFEIEKWSSPDSGRTWRSNAVTWSSERHNVRPVVPRGYAGPNDHVLWMQGDYTHYTDYRTGIQLLLGSVERKQ